jgi:hypothetical protein
MRKAIPYTACLLPLMLVGCSESTPAPQKKEEAKAEAIGGHSALFKMYQKARAWSADAQVLSLNSIHLQEVPQTPGTAGAWQAVFTSDQLGKSKTYTYSVVESTGNLHKGAFDGPEEGWAGKRGTNTSFPMAAVKIETDAAYKTALEQAADYDKKNPGMTISFVLEKNPKYNDPSWRVVWGESVGTSNFSVFVDASMGGYLGKMH